MKQKTKKAILRFIFGGAVGGTIGVISGYGLFNWQWWVAFFVILIPAMALDLIDN